MDPGQTPTPDLPDAAWYYDPGDPALLRYWDGCRWTDHTTPVPSAAPNVVAPTPAPASTPAVLSGAASVAATAAGVTGRLLRRAKVNRSQTPPTVEEILAGCRLEDPRFPLEEQVEVIGETHYVKGIKRVFAQQGLTITPQGATLEMMTCALVPNPWNAHDPNAVAVCVDGQQVGHLPAEMCPDYAPHLIALARHEVLVTGEARLWAKSDAGVVRARVTILIPEARQLR